MSSPLSLLLDRRNLPRLDRGVRPNVLAVNALRDHMVNKPPLVLGIVLLWHDHWEAAHEVAQSDEGERDHDLLHYFVHRREGDFGNAGYWLHSVERHPFFDNLASRVDPLLPPGRLRDRILPNERWNARGFLDAVRQGVNGPDDALLRALQAEEFILYAEWLDA